MGFQPVIPGSGMATGNRSGRVLMAQKVAEEPGVEESAAPARVQRKSGKLVLFVGVVVLIVTAQAIITYLLMPKASEQKAEDPAGTKAAPAAPPGGEETAETAQNETAEVPLGDYNCTNST